MTTTTTTKDPQNFTPPKKRGFKILFTVNNLEPQDLLSWNIKYDGESEKKEKYFKVNNFRCVRL